MFDISHCRDETVALSFIEWFEERPGESVTASVKHVPLRASGGREARDSNPLVGRLGIDRDKTSGLKGAENAGEIAGVEIEPGPQDTKVTPIVADLPEHAGLSEGAVAGEESIVESADTLSSFSDKGQSN